MKRAIALLLTVILTAGSFPVDISAADTLPSSENAPAVSEEVPAKATDLNQAGQNQANQGQDQPAPEEDKTENQAPAAEQQSQETSQDPQTAPSQDQNQENPQETAGQESPAAAEDEETAELPPAQEEAPKEPGWYLEEDGWHNYYSVTENGETQAVERVSEWYVPDKKMTLKEGDASLVLTAKTTYYFDENGALVTNRQVPTVAYKTEMEAADRFFDSKGVPVTGYAKYGGEIHYILKKTGLVKETMVNLSKKGQYTLYYKAGNTKKFNLPAGRRYFDADGCMVTGEYQTKDNGIQYFNEKGLRQTGFIISDGTLAYYEADTGKAAEKFVNLSKAATITDTVTGKAVRLSSGKRYFDADGNMVTGEYQTKDNGIQYFTDEGINRTGYLPFDGDIYFYGSTTGKAVSKTMTRKKTSSITDVITGKSVKVLAGTRYFTEEGYAFKGWYPSEEEKTAYYSQQGLIQTGYILVDGTVYFAEKDGTILKDSTNKLAKDTTLKDQVTDKSLKLPGGTRYFGQDGAMRTGWYPSEEEKSEYYSPAGLRQTGYISVNGELFYIDGDKGLLKDAGNTLTKNLTITDQLTGKSVTLTKGTRYFDAEGRLVHGEYDTRENGTQYFDTYGNAIYGYVYYDGNLHYIDKDKGKLRNAVNSEIDGLKDVVNQDAPSTYVRLTPGSRYFDENGNAVTGGYRAIDAMDEAKDKHYFGTMYFFEDGAMAYRFTKVDGNWKYFQKSGGMVTGGDFDFSAAAGVISSKAKGAYSFDGETYFKAGHYYFDNDGVMQTGIIEVDGKRYAYSDTTGRRADSGWVLADGIWYLLESDSSIATQEDGTLITGTPTPEGFLIDPRDNKTYMVNDDGSIATGWHKVGDKWYHFNETTGVLDGTADSLTNQFVNVDGKYYYFDDKGKFVTDWKKIKNKWYYFDKKGVRADDTTVFGIVFDENGVAKTGGRSYTSYKNYTHYPVTDEMIGMVKRAQEKLASRNPTHWYCFTDKDHHRAGFFQYKSGKWNLVIYTSVAVGAWVNGRSKTPTTITEISQKPYRMTHFTSFYFVSWTRAGVGYHTPLYNISRHEVNEKTPQVDSRTSGHISNGCMRLGYYNAYWVYHNVPIHTWVQMYGR